MENKPMETLKTNTYSSSIAKILSFSFVSSFATIGIGIYILLNTMPSENGMSFNGLPNLLFGGPLIIIVGIYVYYKVYKTLWSKYLGQESEYPFRYKPAHILLLTTIILIFILIYIFGKIGDRQREQENIERRARVSNEISEKRLAQQTIVKTTKDFLVESSNSVEYKGRVYPTVKIGDQIWFAKSLNIDNQQRCWNSKEGIYECGSYTWSSAMNLPKQSTGYEKLIEPVQGICPNGWHIPSNEEFGVLESLLVENSNCDVKREPQTGWTYDDKYFCQSAGDFLKVENYCFLKENCNKTNFSLYLDEFGFDGKDNTWDEAYIWTSTQLNNELVVARRFSSQDAGIAVSVRSKNDMQSQVRCIKN